MCVYKNGLPFAKQPKAGRKNRIYLKVLGTGISLLCHFVVCMEYLPRLMLFVLYKHGFPFTKHVLV